jgi:hypothetical protein
MDYNNTNFNNLYDKPPTDYTLVIALYCTIVIIAKICQTYFKYINFEYDENDKNDEYCVLFI